MSAPLTVAILHYHLRGGGVTRVIEHTAEAFAEHDSRLLICSGESPGEEHPLSDRITVINGLSYGREDIPDRPVSELKNDLYQHCRKQLGTLPDLWHIHNHSLGKNMRYVQLVLQLARDEQHVLLQLHDFAEDGRPANYLRMKNSTFKGSSLTDQLYPAAPNIHYALLTRRDADILSSTDIPESNIHVLSNPVSLPESDEEPIKQHLFDEGERLILYPTRGIRRKNMGELLLWSILADEGDKFAVTLAPKNPEALPVYNSWVNFAENNNLPVLFEATDRWPGSFRSLMDFADAMITTSVAEGFGLAFLEPYLLGKPVLGRDLPDITADFKEKNIDLSGLYNQLLVPLDWLSHDTFIHELNGALGEIFDAYQQRYSRDVLEQYVAALIQNDMVDFGVLNEKLQRQVLQHLIRNPDAAAELDPPSLDGNELSESKLDRNRRYIQENYNVRSYGNVLQSLYHKILASPAEPPEFISANQVLDRFLQPKHFSLLRT